MIVFFSVPNVQIVRVSGTRNCAKLHSELKYFGRKPRMKEKLQRKKIRQRCKRYKHAMNLDLEFSVPSSSPVRAVLFENRCPPDKLGELGELVSPERIEVPAVASLRAKIWTVPLSLEHASN